MRQQCPKCGNWVEGHAQQDLKRKVTDSAVKKGAGAAIGAVVGTFIAPGIGTALGGAVGDFLLSKEIDKASNKANEMLYGEADYEFVCPNCNHRWISRGEGEGANLATKEQYIFNQEFEYFVEHSEEIGATVESVNAYLSKLNSIALTCDAPKSEMLFLAAWVAYMAQDKNRQFITIAEQNIHKALRLLNDEEYQLFALMVENKQGNRDAEKITREALKLFADLNSDTMLLKEEYYSSELDDAIQETLQKYIKGKKSDANVSFFGNNLWCLPPLVFFIYKYSNYEPNIWLFSWAPIYVFLIFVFGVLYFSFILMPIFDVYTKSDNEWRDKMINEYVGFKWSDLFK